MALSSLPLPLLILFFLISLRVCVSRVLNWRIPHIGSDNKSGALEFSVPEVDSDSLFPIEVSFSSGSTLSQIGITGVVQAEDEEAQVKFDEETQMSVEKYTIE